MVASRYHYEPTVEFLEVIAPYANRIYSGRPGCGCGCLGSYSDSQRGITRKVNTFRKLLQQDSGRWGDWSAHGSQHPNSGNSSGVVAFETEDRYNWLYFDFDRAEYDLASAGIRPTEARTWGLDL